MKNVKRYFVLLLLTVVFSACNGKLVRPGDAAHPDTETLSVNESTIIFYRGEGNADFVPTITVNDRVVGSLLPNRFAQTRGCKGTVNIGVINGLREEQTIRYYPSMDIKGSGNVYLKVDETGDGHFSLAQVDEQTAKKDLTALEYESHIINRHIPDCTPVQVAPPPPPPPPAPVVVLVDKVVPVVLKRVNLSADALFKYKGSQLKDMLPKGRAGLDALVKEIQTTDLKVEKLRIAGHTDRIASETYNLKLSKARAQTVADYLRSHGLEISMEVVGYGESDPVTTGCVGTKKTPELIECLQPDRRVVVDLIGQKTVTVSEEN